MRFEDKPIGALGAANILKLGIAMVPEGRRLFSSLTVEENLLIGSYGRDVAGIWSLDSIYGLFPAVETSAAPRRATRYPAESSRWRRSGAP